MTGTRPAGRLGQFSWALFDFANQPYFTLVTLFVFAPYFATVVVGDPVHGQALWGYARAVAGTAIAIASPVLGAIADASGRRKPWIFAFQTLCAVACWMLWYAMPGAPGGILPILIAIVMAGVGAEFSIVFNNAMLPNLTTERRVGRLSGYAWALGYVGGLAALFLVLFAFSLPQEPLFGLDKSAHEHERIVGPLAAVWSVVFVTPLFLFTPDAPRSTHGAVAAVSQGVRQVIATLRNIGHYRNIGLFLIAHMFYSDGIIALFAFGGIYARRLFGWDITALALFGIIGISFGALGAVVGGWLDDRFGSKQTVLFAVAGAFVATVGIVSVSTTGDLSGRGTVLFFLDVSAPSVGSRLFASAAEQVFLFFGVLVAIFGGPMQAASRTMVSRLASVDMIGEFYGLFSLSGRATAFLAPLVIAVVTAATDSQRLGFATILIFLACGLALLLPVREQRSVA